MRHLPWTLAATALMLAGCVASRRGPATGGAFSSLPVSRVPDSGASRAETISAPDFGTIQVPPARSGEILVIICAGPVANKGKHWFPEGTTLATALDWAGLDTNAPPRSIYLVDPKGHGVRHRVEGRPREELEQVKMGHGSRIVVPWDRCFGLGPNKSLQPRPRERAWVRFAVAVLRPGLAEFTR